MQDADAGNGTKAVGRRICIWILRLLNINESFGWYLYMTYHNRS